MREILRTVHRADRVLSITGWIQVALLASVLLVAPFDSREILGINPWIKPIKFLVSVALYVWTVAWFLRYLAGPRWVIAVIRWTVATSMIIENLCIALQSLNGVPSHYNVTTPVDWLVFSVMGTFILINTLAIVLLLYLFLLKRLDLPPAYLLGIRSGLVIFLLASFEGMFMILNQAHGVGVADGGPGLPLINWSTQGGDLRVAHFLGLHALQLLPLFGWWVRDRVGSPKLAVLCAAAAYLALAGALLWQALLGKPLLAL